MRRLQRKVSKKYLINKKGVSYVKTSNIIKLEKEIVKLHIKLSDRVYKCECGNVIDRDYQASINLSRYKLVV